MAALVAGAAWLAGCGVPPSDGGTEARWIDGAPADELVVTQLERLECVVGGILTAGTLPPGIEVIDADSLGSVGGAGITLRGGALSPRLRFERSFEPGEIDAVRLAVFGVRRGNVRLRWFLGAAAEPAGALELTKAQGGGTLHDQFFFDLASGLPQDRPVRIEIEPTTAAGEVITVSEVCAGRAHLDPERLDIAARVPWRATLGDESREILVQPSAGWIERKAAFEGPAELSVGFGRLAGSSPAVRLTVRGGDDGAPLRVLAERVLTAAELAQSWINLTVELADMDGAGTHSLRLEAASEPPGDPAFVAAWSSPRLVLSGRRSKRPNLVLISLDTLRADRLSLYGYHRQTSPLLDAWARERNAAVFRQVVAPSGWTLPSHFSLFTGLEAFRHPANYNTVSIDTSAFRFLAERLVGAGYRTQAFTGGGFVHPAYGLSKGFESFVYWGSKERRSEELVSNLRLAGSWLDREASSRIAGRGAGDPFLLFLHTYEIHTPYTAREPYFSKFSRLPTDLIADFEPDGDILQRGFLGTSHLITRKALGAPSELLPPELAELPSDLYDSAIGYVDELLTPFLRRLSQPPFDDNTVIVIFSDHGESLGEGGRAGHAQLSLDNLLVPLIVVRPGAARGQEIFSQVRLIDLFPTVLELAGLEGEPGTDGRSLMPLLEGGAEPEGRPAFAYAPSTNHGMSLLSPTGLKLDWRNSVWKPIAGDLLWFRHEGYKETLLASRPATPEADRMVRSIQQVFSRDANGLRFELRNLSREAVRVSITSELIDPSTVKSPQVEGVHLDWKYIGYLDADVPAGAKLALLFDRPNRREIEMQVGVAALGCGESVASTAIATTVDQLRQPLRRHLELPACSGSGAGGAPTGLELEVAWQGPLPAAGGAQTDAALREDLKALGYIH